MRHFRFINLNDSTWPPPLHDNLCAAALYAMSFPMKCPQNLKLCLNHNHGRDLWLMTNE
jgi:hypothetical protein